MSVLMSIKPKWWDLIKSGEKTLELRRILPKYIEKGDMIYFYVSAPVKAICGSVKVKYVCSEPNSVASHFMNYGHVKTISKVDEVDVRKYFEGSKFTFQGFGLELNNSVDGVCLDELKIKRPPQNYQYLTIRQEQILKRKGL